MKKYLLVFILLVAPLFLWANKKHRKYARPSIYTIEKRSTDAGMGGQAEVRFSYSRKKNRTRVDFNINDLPVDAGHSKRSFTHRLKPGKYCFNISAKGYYPLRTDSIELKENEVVDILVKFEKRKRKRKTHYQQRKPVIYLYADTITNVQVKVETKGNLTCTYPEYNNGWNCTVLPGGKINVNDKEYNYLFWEAETDEEKFADELNDEHGFIVAKNDLRDFLETSLTKIGLNTKEQQDFITYWYPQMIKNENNHIRFLFNEAFGTYARLNITPQPDNLLRVFMMWKKADENTELKPQVFPAFSRNGFTVVEWGGSEIIIPEN